MDNQKYLALTIGPIFKTITSVKSTKAVWAASYFFSYLMKRIIAELKNEVKFLVPYTKDIANEKGDPVDLFDGNLMSGVGLFPDRFIALGTEEDYQKLLEVIDTVIKYIAIEITWDLTRGKFRIHEKITESQKRPTKLEEQLKDVRLRLKDSDLVDFLKNYLQIYCFLTTVGADENPVFTINSYLDTLELQQNYVDEEAHPYLNWFFENVYYNFLVRQEFSKSKERFPSVIEIATKKVTTGEGESDQKYQTLVNQFLRNEAKASPEDKSENQQEFLDSLQQQKFALKQRHKYLTIVQADGDNIGNLIAQINEQNKSLPVEERFAHFSRQLFAFSFQASRIIREFGGEPVYAGGDDLLFFAPVADSEGRSIDYLIERLDKCFNELIVKDKVLEKLIEKIEKKPSMSYGVGISYYKYPLNEALENGNDLLFRKAKKTASKNAVSFSVLKHSGQTFGASLHKSDDKKSAYQIFRTMLQQSLKEQEIKMIHSIIYKLDKFRYILDTIFEKETASEMLQNFFDENFNEGIHKESVFLESVQNLVLAIFTEKDYVHLSTREKLEQVYGAIRFVKFLNDDYEKER